MRCHAQLGSDYQIQGGKMVLEIKPRGFTKAAAIEEFLRSRLLGRKPVSPGTI